MRLVSSLVVLGWDQLHARHGSAGPRESDLQEQSCV